LGRGKTCSDRCPRCAQDRAHGVDKEDRAAAVIRMANNVALLQHYGPTRTSSSPKNRHTSGSTPLSNRPRFSVRKRSDEKSDAGGQCDCRITSLALIQVKREFAINMALPLGDVVLRAIILFANLCLRALPAQWLIEARDTKTISQNDSIMEETICHENFLADNCNRDRMSSAALLARPLVCAARTRRVNCSIGFWDPLGAGAQTRLRLISSHEWTEKETVEVEIDTSTSQGQQNHRDHLGPNAPANPVTTSWPWRLERTHIANLLRTATISWRLTSRRMARSTALSKDLGQADRQGARGLKLLSAADPGACPAYD